MIGYDPIELSQKIERKVVEGDRRKYYRFRKAKFYGGIATADCVGCNLSCVYCWSDKPRRNPGGVGKFYKPEEVSDRLLSIASRHNLPRARISGNEPTIGKTHLLSVLEKLDDSGLNFILETNGILMGDDVSFVRGLSDLENVHVRVSLKGCTPEQFSEISGAEPESFDLQIKALKNLLQFGVSCHAAVIREFVDEEGLASLERTLTNLSPVLAKKLEFENLILYPFVKKRLDKRGIRLVD